MTLKACFFYRSNKKMNSIASKTIEGSDMKEIAVKKYTPSAVW